MKFKNRYNLSELTNALACKSSVRETDATGIAYNQDEKLIIHKEPKSAIKMDFKVPKHATCIMGHIRHSTQGDKKKNYNNHPFTGRCQNRHFALAHNGVLVNEEELNRKFNLPNTKIETGKSVWFHGELYGVFARHITFRISRLYNNIKPVFNKTYCAKTE